MGYITISEVSKQQSYFYTVILLTQLLRIHQIKKYSIVAGLFWQIKDEHWKCFENLLLKYALRQISTIFHSINL